MATEKLEYYVRPPGKVLQDYSDCRSRVSIIIGPLGSGKTVQTILKLLDLMCEQDFVKNKTSRHWKTRPSRILAVRNTYSELFTTTIKDWLEIHGELGPFNAGGRQPPHQTIEFNLTDGTKVVSEIIFIAFDRPDHVKKARGLQPTWIWLNEVKELDKSVIDMLDLRHGRYPTKAKEYVAPTHHGMIGDTNAPDTDHWLYHLAEEVRPKDWSFFKQPGGLVRVDNKWKPNHLAENLENLPGKMDYYVKGMEGKADDWISVNLANEYGYVSDGKPVHPWYIDSTHCMKEDFIPSLAHPIVLGFDFGRTPACVFVQKSAHMRWIAFDEFLAEDMGAVAFAPLLKKYIDQKYPNFRFKGWGDPSGDSGSQSDDRTPFMILRSAGIPCYPTYTNDIMIRRASLENPLKELCMDGKPRFMITPDCVVTRKGLQGGFCYRRVQISGERYTDVPDKNKFSHPCEALEYALQGEGEGRRALVKENTNFVQPAVATTSFDVFSDGYY